MLNRFNHQSVSLNQGKRWKLQSITKTSSQKKNVLTVYSKTGGAKPLEIWGLFFWLMSQAAPRLRPSHTGSMSGIVVQCPRLPHLLQTHPVVLCQVPRITSRITYNVLTLQILAAQRCMTCAMCQNGTCKIESSFFLLML